MPSYTPSYTTVERVCAFLTLDANDEAQRADAEMMLEYAEFLAEQYMGTSYVHVPGATQVVNGLGTNMLSLVPVFSAITKVELLDSDGVVAGEFSDVVPMPSNPRNGGYRWLQRRNGLKFPEGLANIKITGDAGTPTVPKGLALACCLTTQHLMNLRRLNAFVRYEINSERQVFQITTKEMDYVPPTAARILDHLVVNRVELSE